MRRGTCYFISRAAAIRYYRPYGYDNPAAAVDQKLAGGEIHIGRPPLKDGETCRADSDGRYVIDDGES